MMRTSDGRWSVEVITTRGGQSFRVKDNYRVASDTWAPTGEIVATIADVRALLGDKFDSLVEVRERRYDGGR